MTILTINVGLKLVRKCLCQHCPVTFIAIPEALHNQEANEFISLTGEVASKVWERYSSLPPHPDSSLKFAHSHVRMNNQPDAYRL